MRIPSSVFAVIRYALALVVITGSVVLMSAPKKTAFTPHDKAYYASEATVNFVRPGLTLKIVSANIAQDGTISVDYKITDPNGLPTANLSTPLRPRPLAPTALRGTRRQPIASASTVRAT